VSLPMLVLVICHLFHSWISARLRRLHARKVHERRPPCSAETDHL